MARLRQIAPRLGLALVFALGAGCDSSKSDGGTAGDLSPEAKQKVADMQKDYGKKMADMYKAKKK